MDIRKYWLDDEIYVYAIDDNDQKTACPTRTDYYLGRKGYGTLLYATGLLNNDDYPEDEKDFIDGLYESGYFDAEITELYELV